MSKSRTTWKALWQTLSRPSSRLSLGGVMMTGIVAGIVLWGGLDTAVELTNREGFCIGCHEMYDNVYLEYRETVHYSNRTGVRATCADCHVPQEWWPKMVRKVQASHELWGKITGSIDTPEKFEAKRLELARREWRRMLANDSLECRNCHGLESMDVARQATSSARQHAQAQKHSITCIACHQGIAHRLPQGMTEGDDLLPAISAAADSRQHPDTAPERETIAVIADTPEAAPLAATAPASSPTIDWETVDATEITLFYPGISHMEWITGGTRIGRDRHGGGWAFNNGETCYACHFDETVRMGSRIVSGAKLEPIPIAGKAAAIPVEVKAAHDGERLYLQFRWAQPPPAEGEQMDAANAVKLALMLDAGKVIGAERSGCWASCHADTRGMPRGDPTRTKYVEGGSLDDGVFFDLLQWRSGDNLGRDGHVAEQRIMDGGSALIEASGERDGGTWTVTFVRNFSGGTGDIRLEPGQTYNLGFAIHDGYTSGRFHHVSLGYTLGIDTEALITARRQ